MAAVYTYFNGVDVPPQIFHCPVDQTVGTSTAMVGTGVARISYGWKGTANVANMPANEIVAADYPATNATGTGGAPHYEDGTTVLYGSNQVRRLAKGVTTDEQHVSIGTLVAE